MAKELTEAGLTVVALERGAMRDTASDGAYPKVMDELTYSIRKKLFQDLSRETVTIRHGLNDTALPYRQLGAFLPGDGVGGAGLHWSGVHLRVDPVELRLRSHYTERYGKAFVPEGMTIQDFGVSYDELEPYFDFSEKVFGTSGTDAPTVHILLGLSVLTLTLPRLLWRLATLLRLDITYCALWLFR
jgi:gluconate 2-dehydrogenase alpha chain